MTRILSLRRLGLAMAIVAGLFAGEGTSWTSPVTAISQADARVGRPMTPVSYAGVARRTTRRAVVGGAVVGGAYVAAPRVGCYQVVDAYGRMIWRCP